MKKRSQARIRAPAVLMAAFLALAVPGAVKAAEDPGSSELMTDTQGQLIENLELDEIEKSLSGILETEEFSF